MQEKVDLLAAGLGDEKKQELAKSIEAFKQADQTAKATGAEQFKSEHSATVGSEAWQQFITHAKGLAAGEEEHRDIPYPVEGDFCLLCGQPLQEAALVRFTKLWEYIEGQAQAALDAAKKDLDKRRKAYWSRKETIIIGSKKT